MLDYHKYILLLVDYWYVSNEIRNNRQNYIKLPVYMQRMT